MNTMMVFVLISLMICGYCSAQALNAENLNLIRSLFIDPRRQQQQTSQQQQQQPFQRAQPQIQQPWQQTQALHQSQQPAQQQLSGMETAQTFNPIILPTIVIPPSPLPPMPQQPSLPRVIDAGSQWHHTGFTIRNGNLLPFSTDTSLLPPAPNDGIRTFQGLNLNNLFQNRFQPNLPRQTVDLRQANNPSRNAGQFQGNIPAPANANTNAVVAPQPILREFNTINPNTNTENRGVSLGHLSPFQIHPFPHTGSMSHPSLLGLSGSSTPSMFQSQESSPSQTNKPATFTSKLLDSRILQQNSKTSSLGQIANLDKSQEWMVKLAEGLLKLQGNQNP